ncbi:MAG: CHASE4 domain-containing protein [Chloroflexota bacterium]
MPLRIKLILSLVLSALLPLILFGYTAFAASTNNLVAVEHANLDEASDGVNRAILYIQGNLNSTVRDESNWDDLHEQAAKDTPDPDWIKVNLDPSTPTSIVSTFNLSLVSIWNSANKQLYSLGPVNEIAKNLDETIKKAPTADEPHTELIAYLQDVYVVSVAPIRTSDGKDPNGVVLMGRKLGSEDVSQIKALTGYDVALYKDLLPLATTQSATLSPQPAALQIVAQGQKVFNQSDPNIALVYSPVLDEAGNTVVTAVIWRSRQAVTAAQSSIASTLVLWFALGTLLAIIVALILGRSIANPLIAMANRADQMAAGDLSKRMAVSSNAKDEVGRLANAFNEMVAKVGARVTTSESENLRLQTLDEYRLNLLTAVTQALHDPLNDIKNYSAVLEMGQYGTLTEAQQRSVSIIRHASAKEEVLLSDLLDFARARQKQLHMVRTRLAFDKIAREVLDSIRGSYDEKHVMLVDSIPDDLPPLFADRIRVEQILKNLLQWTLDSTARGGKVNFTATVKAGYVSVAISDTSQGLSPEEKAALFELFHSPKQNGQNGNQAIAGNGFGLALVKALIEQQSGTISIDVQHGIGNTFLFTLPIADTLTGINSASVKALP